MGTADDFSLFSSLRYDPALLTVDWNTWSGNPPSPFLLFPFHLDRLIEAAQKFNWSEAQKTLSGEREQLLEKLRNLCLECANREEN